MNIQLEKDIFLTSDEIQFTLKKLMGYDKNEKAVYKPLGYYSELDQALNGYVKFKTKTSEATTLQQVRNELQALRNHIDNLVNGGKHEIFKTARN